MNNGVPQHDGPPGRMIRRSSCTLARFSGVTFYNDDLNAVVTGRDVLDASMNPSWNGLSFLGAERFKAAWIHIPSNWVTEVATVSWTGAVLI